MTDAAQLQQAIAALEAQRAILGAAVVDVAIAPLRAQLAARAPASPSPPVLAAERKIVTVMFADLSGFTALSETLDPEQVRHLMNRCFSVLVPVVERFGGSIDKFIGDAIMALFGAPVAHERHAERALLAALDLLDALAEFNRRHNVELGIHIGVNTGLVVAGGLGSEGRQQYSVMGDSVNLAARLEDLSETGQILVGPNTYRLTAAGFVFELLPPVRVKGKAEPVLVHRLIGRKEAPGPERGIAGLHSPLIGREQHLAQIRATVAGLAGGSGAVLSLIGEAGLGKSRLVAEARRALGEQIAWAEGRALSYSEGISYWLASSILDGLLGVRSDAGPAEVGTRLRELVGALLPDHAANTYPLLARLRGLPLGPDDEVQIGDLLPEALQREMRHAFAEFVGAAARQQPLVLVWEDLHWADPSSLDLLASIFPLVDAMPLLVLLVFRPMEGRAWDWHRRMRSAESGRHVVIELMPLSQTESAALIEHLLVIENLPETTRATILSKAEGNPFFLEELLRSLIDSGMVLIEGGRAQATRAIADLEVPDTLHDVIAARIDRLALEDKQALQTASVIGRVFQEPVLEQLIGRGGGAASLGPVIDSLHRRELIRRRTEQEYLFKHALTREITYQSLLIARRKELHRLTAETIEALFPDQRDELAPTLG